MWIRRLCMRNEYEFVKHIEATPLKFFFVSMTRRLNHWHSDVEILMIFDGSVILETGNRKYKLSKDDIFILNPNEIHSLSRTEESNMILAVQFDPKFCKAYFPDLQKVYFKSQHITMESMEACYAELRKYLLQIVKEFYKKDQCYKLKLMSTLNLMVSYLIERIDYEYITEKEVTSRQKNLDRLNHIILYVNDNFTNKISLKEIAEKENLDMYYLSHFIKRYLGISFQEYLNKLRLEKAEELLLRTHLSFLDICIESGFSDYRYLNKMFLKEFGLTASEYKKHNINSHVFEKKFNNETENEVIHSEMVLELWISYLDITEST